MSKLIKTLLVSFCTSLALGQNFTMNQGIIEQKKYFEKISYEGKPGSFKVKVAIAGKTYNFLFDTGAPFAITESLQKELNLEVVNRIDIRDSNGSSTEQLAVRAPKINLGELSFLNTVGIVLPSTVDVVYDCQELHGIIGSNMLRNSIVQFDHFNKTITITDNAKNLPLKKETGQHMKLDKFQSNPLIKVQLGKDLVDWPNFDSGFSGFYEIQHYGFTTLKNKENAFKEVGRTIGNNVWGVNGAGAASEQFLLQTPSLSVNKTIFKDVTVGTSNSSFSLMGAKLFEQGIVTLDYKKRIFYFEPRSVLDIEKLTELPWTVQFTLNKNHEFIVGIIWDEKLKKDINLGDEIVSFDGVDYKSKTFCELFKMNRNPSKERAILALRDKDTGENKSFEISRIQKSN